MSTTSKITVAWVLNELSKSIDYLENPLLTEALEALYKKLANNHFYIAVLGSFKRGKSSIINALIEKNIVPTGIVPVTTIVTLISYKEKKQATIYFNNGTQEVCLISEISQYVSEAENPKNIKEIRYLDIGLPIDWLKGITIVDTPGIGSGHLHNTEEAFSFVPQIDMALYVLGSELPISQEDLVFIEKIQPQTPALSFILNKSDLLSPTQQEQLIAHNTVILNERFGQQERKLLPVSTLEGHLINIDTLRQRIIDVKTKEKSKILVHTFGIRIKRLLHKTNMLLVTKEKSLQLPLEELDAAIATMRTHSSILKEKREDYFFQLEGRIKNLQQQTHTLFETFRKELVSKYVSPLENEKTATLQQIDNKGYDFVLSNVGTKILVAFQQKKEEVEQQIIIHFKKQIEEDLNQSGQFLQKLISGSVLNEDIEVSHWVDEFDLNTYSSFYFRKVAPHSSEPQNDHHSNKVFLKKWRLEAQRKQLVKSIASLILSNAANSAADIQYKIREGYRSFYDHLIKSQLALLQSLETSAKKVQRKRSQKTHASKQEIQQLHDYILDNKKLLESIVLTDSLML